MNNQFSPGGMPQTLEEALAMPRPKPQPAGPTLVVMLALWGLCIYGLHAALYPAKPVAAVAQTMPGLNAQNALELTDEVVSALAADQFSSVLLKIELAQKVAQRLQPVATPQR
ncbi:MAG TPA: hypothetical protein VHP58_05285 [Alphaproteobacteria bacterium]|nr:hypothetical protein [Alphaproteobacteria bacterium]